MDINNVNPNQVADRRVKGDAAERTPPRAPDNARSDGDDQVRLSDEAQSLQRARQSAREAEFDRARVEAIRQAIAEGRYHVDPERLAERFVALEKELNQ